MKPERRMNATFKTASGQRCFIAVMNAGNKSRKDAFSGHIRTQTPHTNINQVLRFLGWKENRMVLALLCMTMFIALTAATLHALREENRNAASKVAVHGKWIR